MGAGGLSDMYAVNHGDHRPKGCGCALQTTSVHVTITMW